LLRFLFPFVCLLLPCWLFLFIIIAGILLLCGLSYVLSNGWFHLCLHLVVIMIIISSSGPITAHLSPLPCINESYGGCRRRQWRYKISRVALHHVTFFGIFAQRLEDGLLYRLHRVWSEGYRGGWGSQKGCCERWGIVLRC